MMKMSSNNSLKFPYYMMMVIVDSQKELVT